MRSTKVAVITHKQAEDVSFCFYLSSTSLLFMRQGLFFNVAISFFFSSTCSFRAVISPSDSDSSPESEEEELEEGKSCHMALTRHHSNHIITSFQLEKSVFMT